MSSIRVYLIDDQAMIRAAFAALLESVPPFAVVGSSGNPREAIEQIAELDPDLIMLDVTMPGLSGLDLVAPIRRAAPGAKILIASNHESAAVVQQALAAGANGYLSKDSDASEIELALAAMLRGEEYISPRLTDVTRDRSGNGRVGSTLDRLTPREREVFQLLALGKSNKQVAGVLELSIGTVKKHRENLQRKLECRSSAELARLAIREGLMTP